MRAAFHSRHCSHAIDILSHITPAAPAFASYAFAASCAEKTAAPPAFFNSAIAPDCSFQAGTMDELRQPAARNITKDFAIIRHIALRHFSHFH
jgi:hypothetical protein